MEMRRLITICMLALSAVALVGLAPGVASAKKKKAVVPQITKVSPMRVSVGKTLTIRGRHFKSKRTRNTVIFRNSAGRTVFAKPRRASRTKLVVVVPAGVTKLIARASGQPKPTRMKLRVLAGKFSKWTSRRLSPVIVAPKGLTQAAACGTGNDWDHDLLPNSLEVQIKTDPCVADTDGDGVEDGYEEQSAIDLNHYPSTPPLPYPGKRPYPNALDPSDGYTDYDSDGLAQHDEFVMWMRYADDGVRRSGRPTTLSGLLYSDGLQKSKVPAPGAPPITTLAGWALEQDGDGVLADDERDVDADGLGNWDEAHGRMVETWWPSEHNGTNEPKESPYPGINFLDNADLPGHDAFADPDVDGDGVPDGADDYDHDGLSNAFEVARPADWLTDAFTGDPSGWNNDPPSVWGYGANGWAYVNPFNPCKPFFSERCHTHPPFGYYDGDQVPWHGPLPPAGFPDTHPATPNN
jgi:IPT/TIG domain